jgi:hypothetical protein
MSKNSLIRCLIILIILVNACSKSDEPSTNADLTGKAFYGVAVANCPSTTVTNLSSSEYMLMTFVDNAGNEISYQPLPNTWYRMNTANTYVKTGSDVTPKDAVVSWDFSSAVRSGPCQ